MMKVAVLFKDPSVADVFNGYAAPARSRLLRLRELVFEVAASDPRIGSLTETLKWGQPSYLTEKSKSGTPVRLGIPKSGDYGIFVHCQTSVISEFRAIFSDRMTYDGNRAVLFDENAEIEEESIRMLIRNALTYRL